MVVLISANVVRLKEPGIDLLEEAVLKLFQVVSTYRLSFSIYLLLVLDGLSSLNGGLLLRLDIAAKNVALGEDIFEVGQLLLEKQVLSTETR